MKYSSDDEKEIQYQNAPKLNKLIMTVNSVIFIAHMPHTLVVFKAVSGLNISKRQKWTA